MEKFQLKYGKGLKNKRLTELLRGESVEWFVTNNHLRSAFWLAKEGVALEKFPGFIGLQSRHGAKMGDFCRSDIIAKDMIKSISTIMFDELKTSLIASNAPLSILAGLLFFQMEGLPLIKINIYVVYTIFISRRELRCE